MAVGVLVERIVKKKICAWLLVFVLAAAVVWWLAPETPASRLPDGSLIAVNSVSCGTNHQTRWDGRWRDYAPKVLPAKFAARITPSLQWSFSYPTNGTVIWFRRWTPNQYWEMRSFLKEQHQCVLLDAQGQPRLTNDMIAGPFAVIMGKGYRILVSASFPPLTGRQTIRVQSKARPGSPAPTNPPVEFVVDIP